MLDTAATLDASHLLAVVRFERDRIVAMLDADPTSVQVVDQDEIPGTGRAVAQAVDALPADFAGDVLVLYTDGLTEARSTGVLLDVAGVKAALDRLRGEAPPRLAEGLEAVAQCLRALPQPVP